MQDNIIIPSQSAVVTPWKHKLFLAQTENHLNSY